MFSKILGLFAGAVFPSWLMPVAMGLTVGAAFAGGFGAGYHMADKRAELAVLEAQVTALHTTLELRDASDALAAQFVAWLSKTETENAKTDGNIDDAISKAAPAGVCLTADFLGGLRNIK